MSKKLEAIAKMSDLFLRSRGITREGVKFIAPEGDGHPVGFIPGFLTDDDFLAAMRSHVQDKGYKVYSWDRGINYGLNKETAHYLVDWIKRIQDETGKSPSLVGHSIGGVFAREVARAIDIRSVTTMGSPFSGVNGVISPLRALYRAFNFKVAGHMDDKEVALLLASPPPEVPTTSVFSKKDLLVNWRSSLNPLTDISENIEVGSGHLLIASDAMSLAVVLDRLAQNPENWRKFDPRAYDSTYKYEPIPEHHLPQSLSNSKKGKMVLTFFK